MSITGHHLVRQAREYVLSNIGEGVTCPCCGRFTKAYKRSINVTMLEALRWIMKHCLRSAVNSVDVPAAARAEGQYDISKQYSTLKHWGLIEPAEGKGRWRVTTKGKQFLLGKIVVPEWIATVNDEVVATSETMKHVQDIDGNYSRDETMAYVSGLGSQLSMEV